MGDLTTNISRHEIACNCECGYDSIDFEVVRVVQEACDCFSGMLGKKCILTINSGCRCVAWNDHEGGSENSQHLYARAIDHRIDGVTIDELAGYYMSRYPGKYGIGVYDTFVHLDTRSEGPARW